MHRRTTRSTKHSSKPSNLPKRQYSQNSSPPSSQYQQANIPQNSAYKYCPGNDIIGVQQVCSWFNDITKRNTQRTNI